MDMYFTSLRVYEFDSIQHAATRAGNVYWSPWTHAWMTLDRNSTAQPPPRMVCVFVATSLGRAPEPATIPSRLANHTKSLCTSAHETVGSTFSGDAVVGAAGGELAEAGAAVADATPVGAVGSATAGWVAAGAAAVASTAAGAATAGLEAAGAAAAGAAAGASPPNSLSQLRDGINSRSGCHRERRRSRRQRKLRLRCLLLCFLIGLRLCEESSCLHLDLVSSLVLLLLLLVLAILCGKALNQTSSFILLCLGGSLPLLLARSTKAGVCAALGLLRNPCFQKKYGTVGATPICEKGFGVVCESWALQVR